MIYHGILHTPTMEESHEGVVVDVVFKKKLVILKCIHGTRKSICRHCSSHKFCGHGRLKCKECGKDRRCFHNKIKENCKQCSPHLFCGHNKRFIICKDCGGSSLCIHKRQKGHCRDCGCTDICVHKLQEKPLRRMWR